MDSDPNDLGTAVSNAIFHVERGHWLVARAVEGFAEAFSGNVWASGGPILVRNSNKFVQVYLPYQAGPILGCHERLFPSG